MKTASCPSCGAPVPFHSAASLYAVCAFCRSTLLREGEDLKNIGRMAELMDDPTLLQVGSEGRFRGVHFGVIGRIQLRYESGLWNEWHILFDDGRSGWLSEAGGEYVVSAQVAVEEALPAFDSLVPEMQLTIAGRSFSVSDLRSAHCISGEGELPFKVDSGYDVKTADLRGNDRFVTLDYSETPPLVFVGYPARFEELALAGLRENAVAGSGAGVRARAFNCPHCAAPLAIHSATIESVGCENCGSILGIENENIRLLSRAAQSMKIEPSVPLGSRGRLQEVDWEVIGFLRRGMRSAGTDASRSEYLLFNAEAGFAWLTEYQGHWNFVRTLSRPPSVARGQHAFRHGAEEFKRFSSGRAEVLYVLGEFYWRVAVGETCLVEDYICPPRMLSREVSDSEASWSQGEYAEPGDVFGAFGLKNTPPARRGIYANQPNPLVDTWRRSLRLFAFFLLAATVLQLAFVFIFSAQQVLLQPLVLSPQNADATLTTREFELGSRARALRVRHATDIENNWVDITTTLVEKNSGEAYQAEQGVSYYRGSEGGESWSEGSRSDAILFRNIPPGRYYLAVEYDLGRDNPRAIVDTVEVVRNPAAWSNYLLLLVFLAIFPLFVRWRRANFESRRWEESDIGGEEDAGQDDEEDDE